MSRWRCERFERAFAHVCETGGGRRAWVRRIAEVTKLRRMRCAVYNFGSLLRKVLRMAKPRCAEASRATFLRLLALLSVLIATITDLGNLDFLAVMTFWFSTNCGICHRFQEMSEIEISKCGIL